MPGPKKARTDFVPPKRLRERGRRVHRRDRDGHKSVPTVLPPIEVDYSNDFDTFASRVAKELSSKLLYRTDGGRHARGLVRVSGDLFEIHGKNRRRRVPQKKIMLEARSFRRLRKNSADWWAMTIRFKDLTVDVVPNYSDTTRPGEKMQRALHADRVPLAIARALFVASLIGGCRGHRIRSWLARAGEMGFPANWNMWYYNVLPINEYRDMSDEGRDKIHARGYIRGFLPFKGNVTIRRQLLSWRLHPIRTVAKYLHNSDAGIKNMLLRIDIQITDSINAFKQSPISGAHNNALIATQSDAMSPDWVAFVEHMVELMDGAKNRDGENVYPFLQAELFWR